MFSVKSDKMKNFFVFVIVVIVYSVEFSLELFYYNFLNLVFVNVLSGVGNVIFFRGCDMDFLMINRGRICVMRWF